MALKGLLGAHQPSALKRCTKARPALPPRIKTTWRSFLLHAARGCENQYSYSYTNDVAKLGRTTRRRLACKIAGLSETMRGLCSVRQSADGRRGDPDQLPASSARRGAEGMKWQRRKGMSCTTGRPCASVTRTLPTSRPAADLARARARVQRRGLARRPCQHHARFAQFARRAQPLQRPGAIAHAHHAGQRVNAVRRVFTAIQERASDVS